MATQGTINLPDMPQLLVTTGEQVFCHGGGTTGNRVLAIRGDAVLEVLAIDYIVARDPQISFTNLTVSRSLPTQSQLTVPHVCDRKRKTR
jgi:hypothetical protein